MHSFFFFSDLNIRWWREVQLELSVAARLVPPAQLQTTLPSCSVFISASGVTET